MQWEHHRWGGGGGEFHQRSVTSWVCRTPKGYSAVCWCYLFIYLLAMTPNAFQNRYIHSEKKKNKHPSGFMGLSLESPMCFDWPCCGFLCCLHSVWYSGTLQRCFGGALYWLLSLGRSIVLPLGLISWLNVRCRGWTSLSLLCVVLLFVSCCVAPLGLHW